MSADVFIWAPADSPEARLGESLAAPESLRQAPPSLAESSSMRWTAVPDLMTRQWRLLCLAVVFFVTLAATKLSSTMGFLAAGVSFVFILYGIVIRVFFPDQAIAAWASVIVAVLFLAGVQLICIGILGEYLGRMYDEMKRRPLCICDEQFEVDASRHRRAASRA
jgi:hypothetical protein